jgi:hypothetical protein
MSPADALITQQDRHICWVMTSLVSLPVEHSYTGAMSLGFRARMICVSPEPWPLLEAYNCFQFAGQSVCRLYQDASNVEFSV